MEFWMTFQKQLGISSSQLTNSYFSKGWLNHQPVHVSRWYLLVIKYGKLHVQMSFLNLYILAQPTQSWSIIPYCSIAFEILQIHLKFSRKWPWDKSHVLPMISHQNLIKTHDFPLKTSMVLRGFSGKIHVASATAETQAPAIPYAFELAAAFDRCRPQMRRWVDS